MKTFPRTSSLCSLNQPAHNSSSKRFLKLKQNLDVYNTRASNYRSELERSFERASRTGEIFLHEPAFKDSSSPSNSYSSKPFSSSSKKSMARLNSSPYMGVSIKNYPPTPSSRFSQKWDPKVCDNIDSFQSNNCEECDTIDQNDFKSPNYQNAFKSINNKNDSESFKDHNISKSSNTHKNASSSNKKNPDELARNKSMFDEKEDQLNFNLSNSQKKTDISNNKNDSNSSFEANNDLTNKCVERTNQKNVNDIIFTPNRIKKTKKLDIEKNEDKEKVRKTNSRNRKENINHLSNRIEKEVNIEEVEVTNPSIDMSKEPHSQAYLQAMNSMNSKMKQFNNEVNNNHNLDKITKQIQGENKVCKNKCKKSVKYTDKNAMNKNRKGREEEDEFKKKQRVEIEEIKHLYNLVEQELRKIKEESTAVGSNENSNENYFTEEEEEKNSFIHEEFHLNLKNLNSSD